MNHLILTAFSLFFPPSVIHWKPFVCKYSCGLKASSSVSCVWEWIALMNALSMLAWQNSSKDVQQTLNVTNHLGERPDFISNFSLYNNINTEPSWIYTGLLFSHLFRVCVMYTVCVCVCVCNAIIQNPTQMDSDIKEFASYGVSKHFSQFEYNEKFGKAGNIINRLFLLSPQCQLVSASVWTCSHGYSYTVPTTVFYHFREETWVSYACVTTGNNFCTVEKFINGGDFLIMLSSDFCFKPSRISPI